MAALPVLQDGRPVHRGLKGSAEDQIAPQRLLIIFFSIYLFVYFSRLAIQKRVRRKMLKVPSPTLYSYAELYGHVCECTL